MKKLVIYLIAAMVAATVSPSYASVISMTNIKTPQGLYLASDGDSSWDSTLVSSNALYEESNMQASASGSSQLGILKSKSSSSAWTSAPAEYSTITSESDSRFIDALILSNDSLLGTTAQLTFAFYLEYFSNLTATSHDGNAWAQTNLFYYAKAGLDSFVLSHTFTKYAGNYCCGPSETSDLQFSSDGAASRNGNLLTMTVDYIIGSKLDLDVRMSTYAYAYSQHGSSASAAMDASHSSYWAGIVSLTQDGQMISDYAVTSDSGTDYSRSFVPAREVPEPNSFMLILLGAVLLGVRQLKQASH